MRCLVTGGAGFIGSHLAEALVAERHCVRILDDFSNGRLENIATFKGGISLLRGDINDAQVLNRAAKGMDVIFHEAGMISVEQSLKNPIQCFKTNVLGTLNVFEAAVRQRVKKIIYASSCAVYGTDSVEPIRESTPTHPISIYAESKSIAERIAAFYSNAFKLKAVGLRYFNVFGSRQDACSPYSGVVSIFLDRFRKRKPITIYGDGRQTRDFIDVRDVVRANLLAAQNPSSEGIYNVGTGHALSLNQLLRYLTHGYGYSVSMRYRSAKPGDIRHSVADTAQARHGLSFLSRIDMASALRDLIRSKKR